MAPMDAHKTDENTNPPTRVAPQGAWGKWLQMGSNKHKAAGAGENWGPLKSENDLEGSTFFSKSIRTRGVPYAWGRGFPYA